MMRQPTANPLKLPRKLLDELGASEGDFNGFRKRRRGPTNRKEQRKASRAQKKSSHVVGHTARTVKPRWGSENEEARNSTPVVVPQSQINAASLQPKPPKSIPRVTKRSRKEQETRKDVFSPSLSPPARISRGARDKLAEDDAEIAALERALGIKGKQKLPKSFEDDGLDDLLDCIDEAASLSAQPEKRRRSAGEEWQARKRRKGPQGKLAGKPGGSDASEDEDNNRGSPIGRISDEGEEVEEQPGSDEEEDFASFVDKDDRSLMTTPVIAIRENPYIAPIAHSDKTEQQKYVPPSLRNKESASSEDLSQLRRQTQGLLNRLSEANLASILKDIEKLYRDHPRQQVSTTLLDLLMALLSDPTTLQDTFLILHAGFIASLHKVLGSDFGAQAIQRIHEEFAMHYSSTAGQDGLGKKLTNLMSLLAELYNFQVISSSLIYDFVRLFLDGLSETNTELLLGVVRKAGPQLRHDNPSSLKDIVLQLQKVVAGVGEERLSMRTKFMIETMNNLKNNRMKTGITASTISSEHTIRMKKILGSLNQRNIRASEPLRIGLKDLQDANKRGKWWLVGASYKDDTVDNDDQEKPAPAIQGWEKDDLNDESVATDVVQLAKEQRMNTDVRRSIFIAIVASTDVNDAYLRLMKLRLKKSQELEIPKVLLHCAGAEEVYNPFYTFLSRRVCSDKKLKMAFQFSLWDMFKRMGEGDDERDDDQEEVRGDKLSLRSIVNLARMFGVLIAEGGLGLNVLKNLNLAYLQPKTRTFVELLLITAIIHSQRDSNGSRDEKALLDMFLEPKGMPEIAGGLRYFLIKVVSKTDVAGSQLDRKTVRWACKLVGDALTAMATRIVAEE